MRALFLFALIAAVAATDGRPPPEKRTFVSTVIDEVINDISKRMKDQALATIFVNAFPNTLDTTVSHATDNDTFIITGDIPAMWLRDSAHQVHPYVRYAPKDPHLQKMLKDVIARQVRSVIMDPYSNAFNYNESGGDWQLDKRTPPMSKGIWEGKYELDSLCSVIRLSATYYEVTKDETAFDDTWAHAVSVIIHTIRTQQRGTEAGIENWAYKFQRLTYAPTDSLTLYGIGPPSRTCGLSRSAFRPSDDASLLPYPIAANAMAVVSLRQIADLTSPHGPHPNATLSAEAHDLAEEIDSAIREFGIIQHRSAGEIYAYEVDCYGNFYAMDDANIPSLLSLPYLGYLNKSDPLYLATRKFVLSPQNPYFFAGTAGEGVGGPHVGIGYIWPMSIIMRALTSNDDKEIMTCLEMLRDTTGGTNFMHESFWLDDPTHFTRKWFAWANTLFGELILTLADERPHLIF